MCLLKLLKKACLYEDQTEVTSQMKLQKRGYSYVPHFEQHYGQKPTEVSQKAYKTYLQKFTVIILCACSTRQPWMMHPQ